MIFQPKAPKRAAPSPAGTSSGEGFLMGEIDGRNHVDIMENRWQWQNNGTKTWNENKTQDEIWRVSCTFLQVFPSFTQDFRRVFFQKATGNLHIPGVSWRVFFSLQYNRRDILGMALDGPGCFYMLNEVFIYTTYGSIEYI